VRVGLGTGVTGPGGEVRAGKGDAVRGGAVGDGVAEGEALALGLGQGSSVLMFQV